MSSMVSKLKYWSTQDVEPYVLLKESEHLLNWWHPDQIYVLKGICDITKKDKITKQVSLREPTVDRIVEGHVESMDIISHFIKVLLDGTQYQLVFGEITGMDISTTDLTNCIHSRTYSTRQLIY